MSWNKLNNFELQALRKQLCLDVSEAAELIAKVTPRTWQYWESGRSQVPEDIDHEIYGLLSMRNQLIEETITESGDDDLGVLKWYHTFDAFTGDYPSCSKLEWRLHQSVLGYLFSCGGDVELSDMAPLNKDCFIYKWFNQLTEEKLEDEDKGDDEEMFIYRFSC